MSGFGGDENNDNGPLQEFRVASRFVDFGLIELEKALVSVQCLMPTEENQPQAVRSVNAVRQDAKEIMEGTDQLKTQLSRMLIALHLETEGLKAANDAIAKNVHEIEEKLRKYGYDDSGMPSIDAEGTQGEMENSEEGNNLEDDSIDGDVFIPMENGKSVPVVDLRSPLQEMPALNESMAGVEITPLVLSSKSSASRKNARSPLTPRTPTSQILKIPTKYTSSSYNPYLSPSPSKLLAATKKDGVVEAESHRVLVKPTRPILSRSTYEILGEEPPPEFYEQQEEKL